MDYLLVLIIIAGIAYLIIFLTETKTEEEEIVSARLKKITMEKYKNDAIDNKKSASIVDTFVSVYIEPIIQEYNRRKQNKPTTKKDLKQIMMEAGKPYSDDDIIRFRAFQVFSCAATFVISSIICMLILNKSIPLALICIIFATVFGAYIPIFSLRMDIKKRTKEIQRNLPDALDLLVVCVEAGLGLDAALSRVSVEQSRTSPILARELGRVSKDILAGINRQDAFRNLANRNNVPDLKSFVALLIQTDKLGTSISQSLRVYSDTVRTKRRQRAEKLAAEASIKMVIPLVLFVLPSMFIVLLGPAILNMIEQFSKK